MYLPNDPKRPISRFVLGDRLVVADSRSGVLERIIYAQEILASYEVLWGDGTKGIITYDDIVGVESEDGVQLPLW